MTSDCRKLRAAAQLREKARFTMRARKEVAPYIIGPIPGTIQGLSICIIWGSYIG
jgi:hypothetical protein